MKTRLKLKSLVVGFSMIATSLITAGPSLASPPPAAKQAQTIRANLQTPYKAPTPSLNAIANNMVLKVKSLTALISVPSSLVVTQPVEISIGYYSGSRYTQRITQMYSSGGNLFNWNDMEGDGQARRVIIHVTLMERNVNGAIATFSFPWEVDLEPLYDVGVTPLTFTLLDDCDRVGKSDIGLIMVKPDDTRSVASFKMGKGDKRRFTEFGWSRTEISAIEKLALPNVVFGESDFGQFNLQYVPPRQPALIPGKSRQVVLTTKAIDENKCRARLSYIMIYKVRQYQSL